MKSEDAITLIYAGIVAIRFHPKNDEGGKRIPYSELAEQAIKAYKKLQEHPQWQAG